MTSCLLQCTPAYFLSFISQEVIPFYFLFVWFFWFFWWGGCMHIYVTILNLSGQRHISSIAFRHVTLLVRQGANQLFKIWIRFALHNDREELSEEEMSFIVWHNFWNYFFNMCVSRFMMGPIQTQLFTSTLRGTVTQEYSHGFNVMLTLRRIMQETKMETSKIHQFHMGVLTDTQT